MPEFLNVVCEHFSWWNMPRHILWGKKQSRNGKVTDLQEAISAERLRPTHHKKTVAISDQLQSMLSQIHKWLRHKLYTAVARHASCAHTGDKQTTLYIHNSPDVLLNKVNKSKPHNQKISFLTTYLIFYLFLTLKNCVVSSQHHWSLAPILN